MDKSQYELFLVNVESSLIKTEPPIFLDSAANSLPDENLTSDVTELSDYYNDTENLNVYLVNEEIVYTESTFNTVDNVCDASSSQQSVERHEQINNFISVSSGKSMEEIFIDVEKGEQSVQFLATDALAELDLDDNDQTFTCTACQCAYDTEEALSLHQFSCSDLHNQIFVTDPESPKKPVNFDNGNSKIEYWCFQCNASFKSESTLTKHVKNHHPLRTTLLDTIDQVQENDIAHKSYACKLCSLKFSREKALHSHERIHENEKNLQTVLNCKNCGKNFTRQRLFEHHFVKCISMQRPRKKQNSNGKPSESDAPVPATKPNIHPCPQCSKMFATRQKVFRHMWIHRKKAFSCEVCAASFGEQHELDEHRLSRHAEESPYVCSECGKSFASRQGLWEHNRIHSSHPNLTFTCDTCGKTFSSRQGYLIHNRTHTGEKPFQCNYCDKSFRDGGTLRKHQRIHTGERPHKCPLCAKGFNQKVVLREHIRWVHASNKNEYPDPSPYYCSLCTVGHTDREELCTHIVKHSDQIAAFNKENSKQNKDESSVELERVAQTAALAVPDGAKYIEKVVQKNRIILQKYSELYKQRDCKTILGINDADGIDEYACQMCGTTFKKRDCLYQHIKNHI